MKCKTSMRRAIIASQIKEAMTARGMSRKQLADAVGRRPSEVTGWLGGNHNFTVDLLSEISEALGVQITGVVRNSGTPVNGYNSLCTEKTMLCDSNCVYDAAHLVGPILLPEDCYRNLQKRAVQRGEELVAYIKGILLKESTKLPVKASDFCGIWREEDFGTSVEEQIRDIKAHRTVHRVIEEL